MKRILYLVGLLILVTVVLGVSGCDSLSAPSSPKNTNSSQQTGIWVSGEGEVTVIPDLAILYAGVEVQKETVGEAYDIAAETMDNIIQILLDSGIAEEDIKTEYFRINQETDYRSSQPDIIVGYTVTNIAEIKIRDINNTGTVIEAVAAAGGDYIRINNLSFTVDDPASYQKEARDKALANALEKAGQIAESAGLKLGEPTYINESSTNNPYEIPGSDLAWSIVASEAGSSISPGETTITVTMQVAYSIN